MSLMGQGLTHPANPTGVEHTKKSRRIIPVNSHILNNQKIASVAPPAATHPIEATNVLMAVSKLISEELVNLETKIKTEIRSEFTPSINEVKSENYELGQYIVKNINRSESTVAPSPADQFKTYVVNNENVIIDQILPEEVNRVINLLDLSKYESIEENDVFYFGDGEGFTYIGKFPFIIDRIFKIGHIAKKNKITNNRSLFTFTDMRNHGVVFKTHNAGNNPWFTEIKNLLTYETILNIKTLKYLIRTVKESNVLQIRKDCDVLYSNIRPMASTVSNSLGKNICFVSSYWDAVDLTPYLHVSCFNY